MSSKAFRYVAECRNGFEFWRSALEVSTKGRILWLRLGSGKASRRKPEAGRRRRAEDRQERATSHHHRGALVQQQAPFIRNKVVVRGAQELTGGNVASLGRVWNWFFSAIVLAICSEAKIFPSLRTTYSHLDKLSPNATLPHIGCCTP